MNHPTLTKPTNNATKAELLEYIGKLEALIVNCALEFGAPLVLDEVLIVGNFTDTNRLINFARRLHDTDDWAEDWDIEKSEAFLAGPLTYVDTEPHEWGLQDPMGWSLRGYSVEALSRLDDSDLLDLLRAESRTIFKKKNQAYGAAYKRRGLLGVLVRIEDKIQRAFRLLDGAEANDEALKDTLMDLENYATIARICEARGNLKGD